MTPQGICLQEDADIVLAGRTIKGQIWQHTDGAKVIYAVVPHSDGQSYFLALTPTWTIDIDPNGNPILQGMSPEKNDEGKNMDIPHIRQYQSIYEEATQALAQETMPTFATRSEDEAWYAFSTIFALSAKDVSAWLDWFCREVSRLSEGRTTLTHTQYYTGIKGHNTQFILKGKSEQRVVMGPYDPPLEFWTVK